MDLDPKTLPQRYGPKEVKALTLDRQVGALRFSPCGKVLAAGGCDATVRRWDATSDAFAPLPPLTGHDGWVQALAFHPDERRLFSADSWGRLSCWPYADKEAKPLWSIAQAHDGWVRCLAVSPDGKRLASCGRDRAMRLWSDDGKKQQELAAGEDVYAVAFHPDGKSLVSGDLQGVVKVWDPATGKAVREFDARTLYFFERLQDVGGVRCLAFDRACTTLAVGGSLPKSGGFVQGIPTLLLFDWATGKLRQTLKGANDNEGFVLDVHFHPDGFVMAVTSGQPGQGKFFFQRPEDAQPFFVTTKMANCHALAVHPNGTRLAVAATNANSNGNGRRLGPNKEYPDNWSPVHVWDVPKPGK
ncbi:MAG TPA: WD40 repeat domain-containing protein [Gemmataceae bacterium]|nr:WD40 repeat domain-containing protein [Gemmataceae bacterium]